LDIAVVAFLISGDSNVLFTGEKMFQRRNMGKKIKLAEKLDEVRGERTH
jgi:hypothetical protein